MVRLLVALMFVAQAAAAQHAIVEPSEWSHYDVVRAPACVTIDGVLAEREWGKAPAITSFSDLFQPERPLLNPTSAKLMWDDKYLYVSFECTDDDVWGTMTGHDDFIFLEEVVEVYIDPEGRGRHYWEIEVSPRNTVLDLMITMAGWQAYAGTLKSYDVKGLVTGAKVYGTLDNRDDRDEKWTVEMAIPWTDFAGRKVNIPPKDGDSWRVQLFRIERPAPHPAEEQIVSWSKSPGVFHEPKNFGVVTFRR